MAKLIIFGFYNKKILLPFGVALVQIIINIMNATFPEKQKNQVLEMFSVAFSEIAVAAIPLFRISAFKSDREHIRKNTRILSALHYFVLFVIFGTFLVLNIVISLLTIEYTKNNKSFQNPHNSGLSSFEGIELIFICLVSIKLLKYKYFIHHVISIIIFILMCFFIDLIVGNFPDLFSKGSIIIILNIIIVLLDALDYNYQKYMMEFLFHSFWGISLTLGLINLICFSIMLIIFLIKGKENSIKEENLMAIAFYKYFEEVDTGIIIVKHILNLILNFALNLLRTLTIVNLTPDYVLISFTISRIFMIVLESKQYECLALFPIQFITLMFYLELIELNFFGLNKNTKRNIHERERREMFLDQIYANKIKEMDALLQEDSGEFND